MNTYNANPGYEMDPQLLTHFNQHLDSLFGVYSKLLPFRMDFAYRKKHIQLRMRLQVRHVRGDAATD